MVTGVLALYAWAKSRQTGSKANIACGGCIQVVRVCNRGVGSMSPLVLRDVIVLRGVIRRLA